MPREAEDHDCEEDLEVMFVQLGGFRRCGIWDLGGDSPADRGGRGRGLRLPFFVVRNFYLE